VKVISKKVLLNKEALNGFKNEIRCLRNIRENPHVLKLYYVYEDLTNFYLVMEYLNGGEI
jgi:serine/threonine protein kinase